MAGQKDTKRQGQVSAT